MGKTNLAQTVSLLFLHNRQGLLIGLKNKIEKKSSSSRFSKQNTHLNLTCYAHLSDLCVLFLPYLSLQALQEKLWNVAAPLYVKQSDLASAAAKQVSVLRPSPQRDLCLGLSGLCRSQRPSRGSTPLLWPPHFQPVPGVSDMRSGLIRAHNIGFGVRGPGFQSQICL